MMAQYLPALLKLLQGEKEQSSTSPDPLNQNSSSLDPSQLQSANMADSLPSRSGVPLPEAPLPPVADEQPVSLPVQNFSAPATRSIASDVSGIAPKRVTNVDFGKSSLGSTDELKKLQDEVAAEKQGNKISTFGEMIGAGLSGLSGSAAKSAVPVAGEIFKQNSKDADQKVQNYKDLVENQKNDPNSPVSQGMRQFFKRFDVDVHGNASAADLEKVFPQIVKSFEMENKKQTDLQIAKDKLEERSLQREGLNVNRDLARGVQQDRLNESKEKTLNNQVMQRTKPAVQVLESADKALELINQIKSGALTDSAQISATLSSDMQLLASGRAGGVSDRQKYAIDNAYSRLAKLKDFVSGNPHSAIPPEYLEQTEIEANALKDEGGRQYLRAVNALKAGTTDPYKGQLLDTISKQYLTDQNLQHVLDTKGVSVGGKQPSAHGSSAGSVNKATLAEYASTHNMDEQAARKFLTSKGYKVE